LQISSGSPTAPKRIPNLVGLTIEVVEDTLRKYELRLGQIENRIDNQKPVGTVLAQTPDHPQRALRRSRIDLVLSVVELPPIPTH
jgi:beta-lactam-binding protein with PASTA domain